MKRLYLFSIRSFIGPFIITLVISMFILVMQFFWVYVDDLMGKGLSFWIILELLFYVSASLIPLALPLAILLSSLMTFGNMSENNELVALKSSGFSLLKIMRPLTIVVVVIALSTFYFANYIIPVANLKWHSLIYDIQNTKLSTLIKKGVYTTDLEGYAIKVGEGSDSLSKDITIQDHTILNSLKTIKAKNAKIYKSTNGNYLFFDLVDGVIMEELELSSPRSNQLAFGNDIKQSTHPDRISHFERATYKLNVTGFSLKRSEEDIFKDKFEMLNVFQINAATDSIQARSKRIRIEQGRGIKNSFATFYKQSSGTDPMDDPNINPTELKIGANREVAEVVYFEDIKPDEKRALKLNVVSKLYQVNQNIVNQASFMEGLEHEEAQYWIEFHRKFALTYVILVLFFVGAPLGALIRKGGFGAPVVIAALVFMIYFVILSIGENLADTYVLAPWLGMWMSGLFFTPIAVLITVAANRDAPIFMRETWVNTIKKWFKRK